MRDSGQWCLTLLTLLERGYLALEVEGFSNSLICSLATLRVFVVKVKAC